ncbi:serine/threonine-protein kinase [Gemmatimonas sp.]|uniref:serine/threonine-protein kinase n=1 Tax=Gemmatimonas sp. TaxID=1962908 RepID=UPI0022C58C99|nr:serine/threonine-protein kinase [Gemmatimonas sp.]MCZ8204429.1 protein kinase [Gemmatimonas sp.]
MSENTAHHAEDAELRAHVEQALSAAYELDQEIGRGGMGIVYRARDRRLKRHVAIKLLPPELSFRRDVRSRFLREAETAAQLSHPNIVPIYSVDEVGNLVFFVMACIDGDNLATLVQKRGPLPVDSVRRWLGEVADALAYAHSRGVVHRDIKPDNILLDGIDGRALVTDFGIARAATDSGETSRLTATGMAIGTPAYMSPEQASGDRDLDARSDLYSLGIVAYQMLCGEPPFVGGTTPALLVKHLAEAPVPIQQRRADAPPDLAAIVMRLLEKNPDHRFQQATELSQALRTGVVPPAPAGATSASVPLSTAPVSFNGAPIGGMPMGGMPMPGNGNSGYQAAPYPAPGYQAPAYSPRTLTTAPAGFGTAAPAPGGATVPSYGYGPRNDDAYIPTTEDRARWEAPRVVKFRRQLVPYLFVNFAFLVIAIFGDSSFGSVTTIWTIFLVWQYTKLWTDGYDWKDVLRQPKHRLFGEVLEDITNSVWATFSSRKREELRAQGKLTNRLAGALTLGGANAPVPLAAGGRVAPALPVRDQELGAYLPLVRAARADREEIGRLLATLPAEDLQRIPDVANTAIDLVQKLEAITKDLVRLEATLAPELLTRTEQEIDTLEQEANPLDTTRSEARVRRLAQLRRERRALVDGQAKLQARRGQVDSCRLALENVRLDLVRLRTGNSSVQSVTLVAEQAMQMAREVDIAVQAVNEVRDLASPRTASRGA